MQTSHNESFEKVTRKDRAKKLSYHEVEIQKIKGRGKFHKPKHPWTRESLEHTEYYSSK